METEQQVIDWLTDAVCNASMPGRFRLLPVPRTGRTRGVQLNVYFSGPVEECCKAHEICKAIDGRYDQPNGSPGVHIRGRVDSIDFVLILYPESEPTSNAPLLI